MKGETVKVVKELNDDKSVKSTDRLMRSSLISHLRREMMNISFLLKERSKRVMFIRQLMYML